MEKEIELLDIADDLFILSKTTVEKLFTLEGGADCFALYGFYYKTAKWQKTNQIKANDTYVMKCLKWGRAKLARTKKMLLECGLIEIIQKRDNTKIVGWYIGVKYIISKNKIEHTKITVAKPSNNHQNLQVAKPTSSKRTTNALRITKKCFKNNKEMLEEQQARTLNQEFEEWWTAYPKKMDKKAASKSFIRTRKAGVKLKTLQDGLAAYNRWLEGGDGRRKNFIKNATTWLNNDCWENDYGVDQSPTPAEEPDRYEIPESAEWIKNFR